MTNEIKQKELIDQEQRDLAVNNLEMTYIVEAAAGTGKTTILVERILSIVRQKQIPLTRIVAITFTEKAAGELKIKLRKKIEQQLQKDTTKTALYRKALLELDLMSIGTIHGFCKDLIQLRPVEAGIDPNSQIIDQITADMLADEVWQTWIAEELSHDCEMLRPLLQNGINLESVMKEFSLRKLYDLMRGSSENLNSYHVRSLDKHSLSQKLCEYKDKVSSALATHLTHCTNDSDNYGSKLKIVKEWLKKIHSFDNIAEVNDWLINVPTWSIQGGSKANWISTETLVSAKDFRNDLLNTAANIRGEILSYWSVPLIEWLKEGIRRYAKLKTERRLLDFHDLLFLARNMLKESKEARDYFKERYDYILVDEFQDTDPLQAEIVFFLAEEKDRFAVDWHNANLCCGKLFIVGDPKQSIYRFRNADLDLYGKVKEIIESQGASLAISMNFRSLPPIIHEVNALFESKMTGVSNGRYEPLYKSMQPYRDEQTGLQSVVMLPPSPGYFNQQRKTDELAAAEAACIAQYIRDLVSSGSQMEINGVIREVSFRDIGILFSQSTKLGILENALRAYGIPYQAFGGKEYASRSEFQALKTVLAALDNPYDTMHTVGALRSPFFGCSDEELLKHRLHGGSFNYLSCLNAEPYLTKCFTILSELHDGKTKYALSETLKKLFEKTAGLKIFALKPLGESRVANLLKVLDIARSLETAQKCSFHDLVQWLFQLEELSTGDEDSPIIESGDDFVQLMTFHKAKGLEFPVAILFRLGQKVDERFDPIIHREKHELEFSVTMDEIRIQTLGYEEAHRNEKERNKYERLRLLYVAMTRACDQLVIPAYWTEKPVGFYEMFAERFKLAEKGLPDVSGTKFALYDSSGYNLICETDEKLRIDLPGNCQDLITESNLQKETWIQRKQQAIQCLNRQKSFAVASHIQDIGEKVENANERSEATYNAKAAAGFGIFVHRVLERIRLPQGENLEEVLKSVTEEYNVNDEETITVSRELVSRALSSELFKTRIVNADSIYRELEYTAELDGIIYEGKMDLVFIEHGRSVIVDYKTDRITVEQTRMRAEFHRSQANIYAKALKAITGKNPEVILYFLRPGVTINL